jgi:hypothetical protein
VIYLGSLCPTVFLSGAGIFLTFVSSVLDLEDSLLSLRFTLAPPVFILDCTLIGFLILGWTVEGGLFCDPSSVGSSFLILFDFCYEVVGLLVPAAATLSWAFLRATCIFDISS